MAKLYIIIWIELMSASVGNDHFNIPINMTFNVLFWINQATIEKLKEAINDAYKKSD